MPTLPFALAMDGENYLHPEGPQLDTSLFSVPSSNMEVEQSNLYTPIYVLLYVFLNFFFSFFCNKSSLFASSGPWRSFSQPAGYCPMQSGNQ